MIVAKIFLQFILTLLLIFIVKRVYGEYCRLPRNELGKCIPFEDCEALKRLIPLAREHQYYRDYLRQTQCKITTVPWVCCPLSQEVSLNSRIGTSQRTELPTSKGGVCGRQYASNLSNRIVGGEETQIGEFPWNVLLVYEKPFYRVGYHCGGSLITTSHVLTAAHCLSKTSIPLTWNVTRVRLGEKDLSSEADCEEINNVYTCSLPPFEVDIEKMIIHDLYDGQHGNPNDIALLKLARQIEFTDFVRPICLPLNDRDVRTDFGTAVIAGFGKTEVSDASDRLMKAEVNIESFSSCKRRYATQGKTLYDSHVCAAGQNSDSCKGDSGGGLVMQGENTHIWFLIGVTSFGHRRCRSEYPGVYVKVQKYIDWIRNKINE